MPTPPGILVAIMFKFSGKKLLALAGLSLTTALISVGCGSSVGDTAQTVPVPEAEYAARYAALFCNNVCCERAGLQRVGERCVTELTILKASEVVGSLRENMEYDATAAARCLLELERGLKSCADPFEEAPACAEVYTGKLGLDSECVNDRECAKFNGSSVSCAGGRCQLAEAMPSDVGERCVVRECVAGSMCRAGQLCIIPGREGDSCFGVGICEEGLVCDAVSARCRPSQSGARCADSLECAVESEYCEPCTAHCAPKLDAGEACTAGEQCWSGHCYFARCSSQIFGVDVRAPEVCVPAQGRPQCADRLPLSDAFSWEQTTSVGPVWKTWGSAADDVFAYGSRGLFHSDGTSAWEPVDIPAPSVEGVWGPTKGDYFVATKTGLYQKTPTQDFTLVDLKLPNVSNDVRFTTITGAPDGSVYAIVDSGGSRLLTRTAEGTWFDEALPLSTAGVRSMHVSAAGDVFALNFVLAARYEGAWSLLPIIGYSVGGVGNEVYLTTSAGLLKAAGQDRFERIQLPLATFEYTWMVSVADSSALFLATATKTFGEYRILFGNGSTEWTQIGSATQVAWIWAASRDDVYIATQNGIVRGRRK